MAEVAKNPEPVCVRSTEAARLLGVSRPKLYQISKRADFHAAFRVDGCTLFSVEKLREWVREQAEQSEGA